MKEGWHSPSSIIQLFISSDNFGTSRMRLDTFMIYRLHYATLNCCVKYMHLFIRQMGQRAWNVWKLYLLREETKKSLKNNLGKSPYRNVYKRASIGCMPVLACGSSRRNDASLCISCFTVYHKKCSADVRFKSFQRWRGFLCVTDGKCLLWQAVPSLRLSPADADGSTF